METNNNQNVDGNNNIMLQNVHAKVVEIKQTFHNVSSELAEAKKQLNDQIALIAKELSAAATPAEQAEVNVDASSNTVKDKHFEIMLDAIESKRCILFLGPDLAVGDNGANIHELIGQRISGKHGDEDDDDEDMFEVQYDNQQGLYIHDNELELRRLLKKEYDQNFDNLNTEGGRILEKLCSLKFPLIVNVTPDEHLLHLMQHHNIDHTYVCYCGEAIDEVEPAETVLFNALGSVKSTTYIKSQVELNKYIKSETKTKFPLDLEMMLSRKQADLYLLLGFDYDKWPYRTLMFELGLGNEAKGIQVTNTAPESINKKFIRKQFKINCIDSNVGGFVDLLIQKCQKRGIETRDLENHFFTSIAGDLETLSLRISDCDEMMQLKLQLEEELNRIIEKIDNYEK